MNRTTGLLLDVDGTLIDSNNAHAHSWVEAFAAFDIPADFAEVRRLIGMGGDHLVPQITGFDKDDSRSQALQKKRGEIFRAKYLPELKAFDGAADLLKTLKAKAYRQVIATSASEKDLHALLAQAELTGLVEMNATASDADQSKPDPDILLAALAKANLVAEAAVMLGDTPYDMEAARKARVRSIGFTCGGWDAEALTAAGAMAVYSGPREFLNELRRGRAPL